MMALVDDADPDPATARPCVIERLNHATSRPQSAH